MIGVVGEALGGGSGKTCLIHYLGGPPKASLGLVPADASVGNGDAVVKFVKRTGEGLTSLLEMALDHDGMDAVRARLDLGEGILEDGGLPGGVLAAVGMAAVYHHRSRNLRLRKSGLGKGGVFGTMVGPVRPASRMSWQSGFPPVVTAEARPSSVMPRKVWLWVAAMIPLTAALRSPPVAFLKPTGMERPEAIWRWVWDSEVRAPMAAQQRESAR